MNTVRFTRLAGWCGILAPIVTFSTTFASIALSPWFSWQDNGLSALGVGPNPTPFNAGLFSGGLLDVVFAIGLLRWRGARSNGAKLAGMLLFAGAGGLALVGVFPDNAGRIHDIVSALYFLATALACGLWGVEWLRQGDRIGGMLSVAAGAATFLALTVVPHKRVAIAVPEILAATLLSSWSFSLGVKMLLEPEQS